MRAPTSTPPTDTVRPAKAAAAFVATAHARAEHNTPGTGEARWGGGGAVGGGREGAPLAPGSHGSRDARWRAGCARAHPMRVHHARAPPTRVRPTRARTRRAWHAGVHPLHIAVKREYTDCIAFLMGRDLPLDKVKEELGWACQFDLSQSVYCLLENGAPHGLHRSGPCSPGLY